MVEVVSLWRFNWSIYIWILLVLLPCSIRHVGLHADIFLLRVHGLHLLWFLPHAWYDWLPCRPLVCSPHLPIHQVRVAIQIQNIILPKVVGIHILKNHVLSLFELLGSKVVTPLLESCLVRIKFVTNTHTRTLFLYTIGRTLVLDMLFHALL